MEWITELLKQYKGEDGAIDEKGFADAVKTEAPKHIVPKDQYNNVSTQLSEANKTLKTLEEKTKNNPDIQKELSALKEKAEELEKENTDLKINSQVTAALQAVGAKDIEYATFKLGKLEIDKDGKVKDLDSKVKDLQTNLPDYFAKSDDTSADTNQQQTAGYKAVDNKLPEGQQTKSDPFADIMAKYD